MIFFVNNELPDCYRVFYNYKNCNKILNMHINITEYDNTSEHVENYDKSESMEDFVLMELKHTERIYNSDEIKNEESEYNSMFYTNGYCDILQYTLEA